MSPGNHPNTDQLPSDKDELALLILGTVANGFVKLLCWKIAKLCHYLHCACW
jgi:hypothetical protein